MSWSVNRGFNYTLRLTTLEKSIVVSVEVVSRRGGVSLCSRTTMLTTLYLTLSSAMLHVVDVALTWWRLGGAGDVVLMSNARSRILVPGLLVTGTP